MNRLFLGLVLATFATPAAASDFRGVFSLFIGAPFLVGAALVAGFILVRRLTACSSGLWRFAPFALLAPAWILLSWVCMFFSIFALIAIPLLWIALFLLSRKIWLHPHGKVSTWLPRVLASLAVATGGIMAWDMHVLLRDGMEQGQGGALVLLGTLFIACLGVCLFAARRVPTR
ncbi:hypothetical protein [uncultured Stenotrophomonas sp.]|uniref:hypothetical protein n=1 Tax=uncultured Stenotrophomonas sp. TaxID=165438 RepID=UPI0028EFCD8F|nr:hypothetical protein [uncultured Stenotrophomonas sp.]